MKLHALIPALLALALLIAPASAAGDDSGGGLLEAIIDFFTWWIPESEPAGPVTLLSEGDAPETIPGTNITAVPTVEPTTTPGENVTLTPTPTPTPRTLGTIYAVDYHTAPPYGSAPFMVRFTAVEDPDIEYTHWQFGDGYSSTERDHWHTYEAAGTYTVSLTATNAYGEGSRVRTGYIVVSPVVTPTVTPTRTITPYPGIHIAASTDITASRAQLNGHVDDPSTDQTVWFVLGTRSGTYSYKTDHIPSGPGSFGRIIESYPLIAGQTYYARAACPNGYSAEEVTWTMAAAAPAPTTTYGTRAESFQASNMTPLTLWGFLLDTGGETFGGGDTGTILFISLIGAVAFIVLFGRAGDVIIPLEIGVLTIGIILPLLAPEFAEIGYGLMVAAVIGVVYSIFRKVV